jgi:hypothetical protein
VGELVLGVVVDALVDVTIEVLQRGGECLVATARRQLVILCPAQFVVLLPQVGFEDLRRRQKPQDGGVAASETALSERLGALDSTVAPSTPSPAPLTNERRLLPPWSDCMDAVLYVHG